jgi:predicted oxidoreductase
MENSMLMKISANLSLSRIVHGQWRLAGWEMDPQNLMGFIQQLIDWGVSSFDHADIYGDYSCEKLFGKALALKPPLRNQVQIITKCGIKPMSDKFPGRRVKTYDYSKGHILASVEQMLVNFGTDRIDLLLLHRPAPFFEPDEVFEAFQILKKEGKVLNFGVSNFLPAQIEMLQKHCSEKLLANQVEISPLCLDFFENGNMEFCMRERIIPMAWSPLAGGRILNPETDKGKKLLAVISEIAEEMNAGSPESVVFAWLLRHPSGIIPVVGSGKAERVKTAVDSLSLAMSHEQWYRIYIVALGQELP